MLLHSLIGERAKQARHSQIALYLLASERSERDTLSRTGMENAIRIYIYIYIGT